MKHLSAKKAENTSFYCAFISILIGFLLIAPLAMAQVFPSDPTPPPAPNVAVMGEKRSPTPRPNPTPTPKPTPTPHTTPPPATGQKPDKKSTTYRGDPVELASGEHVLTETFAVLPGRYPVSVGWTFRAGGLSNGPMGQGTAINLDWKITIDNSTVVGGITTTMTLIGPDGSSYPFVYNSAQQCYRNVTNEAFLSAKLYKIGTGTTLPVGNNPAGWTSAIRWKNGIVWYFDSNARLYYMRNRLGYTVSLTRGGVHKYIREVKSGDGRKITFEYTDNEQISRVRLWDNRAWLIQYDRTAPSFGNQTYQFASITDPRQKITRYTWTNIPYYYVLRINGTLEQGYGTGPANSGLGDGNNLVSTGDPGTGTPNVASPTADPYYPSAIPPTTEPPASEGIYPLPAVEEPAPQAASPIEWAAPAPEPAPILLPTETDPSAIASPDWPTFPTAPATSSTPVPVYPIVVKEGSGWPPQEWFPLSAGSGLPTLPPGWVVWTPIVLPNTPPMSSMPGSSGSSSPIAESDDIDGQFLGRTHGPSIRASRGQYNQIYVYNMYFVAKITDRHSATRLINYYDGYGRVLQQWQPQSNLSYATVVGQRGSVTDFIYQNLKTTLIDAFYNKTEYNFVSTSNNKDVRLSSVKNAFGQTTTFNYNGVLLESVVDHLGRTTSFAYDSEGRTTRVTSPRPSGGSMTSLFEYDSNWGRLIRVTDPKGRVSTVSVNPTSGNIISATDVTGVTTQFIYNLLNDISSVSVPKPGGGTITSSFTYDSTTGVLLTATDPNGKTRNFTYDSSDRLITTSGPDAPSLIYSYNEMDQMTGVYQGSQRLQGLEYDDEGNVKTVINALGKRWQFTYDGMDRVFKTTNPLGQWTQNEYDLLGNLVNVSSSAGNIVSFSRGLAGRIEKATYKKYNFSNFQSTVESTVNYSYNTAHLLSGISDSAGGSYTPQYDAVQRLIGETVNGSTVTWTLDDFDQTQTLTQPGQPVVTYGYDNFDRLFTLTQGSLQTQYHYDSLGRVDYELRPGGIRIDYGFDNASQLSSLVHSTGGMPLLGRSFTRDGVGRIKTAYEFGSLSLSNGATSQYTYDTLGRLTQAQLPTGTYGYEYDLAGNRTIERLNGATIRQFTYNDANRITKYLTAGMNPWDPGLAVQYDGAGNLTQLGNKTFTWNVRGELTGSTAWVNNIQYMAEYSYDVVGNRSNKSLRAGYGAPFQSQSFAYAGLTPIGQFSGGLDNPIRFADGSYPLTDERGSTIRLVNTPYGTAGYQYDPFGNAVGNQGLAWMGNAFQWTGRENDGVTGLYYFRARYYSPEIGRFISEDPIGFAGSPDTNLYAYCMNDPINFIDPLGLQANSLKAAGGVLFGIGEMTAQGLWDGLDTMAQGGPLAKYSKQAAMLAISAYRYGAMSVFADFASGLNNTFNFLDNAALDNPFEFGRRFGKSAFTLATLIEGAAGIKSGGGGCFVAGTPVTLGNGSIVAIETVKVGDTLLARDPATGKMEAREVKSTSKVTSYELVTVALADPKSGAVVESITGTPNHPFWVEGRGWVPLGDLGIGTSIVTRAGPSLVVKSSQTEAHPDGVFVYNFEVEGYHTYFVGTADGSVCVHNGPPCGIFGPGDIIITGEERSGIAQSLRQINRGDPPPSGRMHARDGIPFNNREGILPAKPAGYYKEYTVPTPGVSNRGARRIVTGNGGERYYTNTHYRNFVQLR